jgi:predicted dehydrogenase
VHASTHEVAPGSEDDVLVLVQHTSGTLSQISGAWRQGAPGPRFRVTGSEATFVVTAPMDGQEDALVAGRTPSGEGDDWGREPPSSWGRLYRGTKSEVVPSERGRWDLFYEQFAAAVRGTAPVPVDPWDAVRTATVLDAARRSAAEGTTVQLSTTSR